MSKLSQARAIVTKLVALAVALESLISAEAYALLDQALDQIADELNV